MIRTPHVTALACACAIAAALLSGCTADSDPAPDGPSASASETPGPTATSTTAPDKAVRLADSYRRSGGVKDVYAIQRGYGPGDPEQLTVWTHDGNEDAGVFDALKDSITGFLHEQGDPPAEDYLLDVFGPDGSLLHRLDTRG